MGPIPILLVLSAFFGFLCYFLNLSVIEGVLAATMMFTFFALAGTTILRDLTLPKMLLALLGIGVYMVSMMIVEIYGMLWQLPDVAELAIVFVYHLLPIITVFGLKKTRSLWTE